MHQYFNLNKLNIKKEKLILHSFEITALKMYSSLEFFWKSLKNEPFLEQHLLRDSFNLVKVPKSMMEKT